jgi:hypothetical protein
MNDRAGDRVPADDPLYGRDAGAGVFRLSYGEDSNVGLFLSDLEFAGSSNRMVAFDGRWTAGKNWVLAGQFARSGSRENGGALSAGTGAMAQILRDGRNFDYLGTYQDFSPEFDAPLGFVKRVGFRQLDQEAKYRWRPDGKALQKYGPEAKVMFNWDPQGRLQDRELRASFQFEFVGHTEIKYERVEAFELFEELPFKPYANIYSANTELLEWLGLVASYAQGAAVNHDPAASLDPFLGAATEAEVGFTFRPTTRIRFDPAFVYSSLRTRDSSVRIFSDQQLRMKLNYQFNRVLSARAIVDYAGLNGNPALADLEDERSWTADLLLTYLVNPGTALYVGYTDRHENVEVVRGPFPTLRRSTSSFASVGRGVFVKLSYLWRL